MVPVATCEKTHMAGNNPPIRINYFGTSSELHGCIADVKRMRPLLEQQGFRSDEGHQMVLLDEAGMDSMRRPTLYNMRKAIQWLTSDAQTGHADHGVFFCVWESWIVMCMSEYQ